MKVSFSVLAFAATLAVGSAQSLGGIPSCALSCFATAVPAAGCSLTDTKCQCTTGKDKITESITSCVPGKCSADDIAKLAPAVSALCANAGVTISDIPTAITSGSTASRTASVTESGSPTSAATGATQSTGAASANGVGFGLAAAGAAMMWL